MQNRFYRRLIHLWWLLLQFFRQIRLHLPAEPELIISSKVRNTESKVQESRWTPGKYSNEQEQGRSGFTSVPSEIVIFSPRVLQRSNKQVESDFFFAYYNSARINFGMNLNISNTIPIQEQTTISEDKRVLILDGNRPLKKFSESEIRYFEHIKKSPNGRIVVDHPDILLTRKGINEIDYWLSKADLLIIHNPKILEITKYKNLSNRFLLWPAYPYPENLYLREVKKTNAILFSGASIQNREQYMNYLIKRSVKVENRMLSNKHQKVLSSYSEYIDTLASCTLGFVNGYRSIRESLLSFKAVEFMLSGTAVLYETGSWIKYFYAPYEHYIPFRSMPDLAVKAKYLLEELDYVRELSNRAQYFHMENYSSRIFWHSVIDALEFK